MAHGVHEDDAIRMVAEHHGKPIEKAREAWRRHAKNGT
jgi:hypothetical protein